MRFQKLGVGFVSLGFWVSPHDTDYHVGRHPRSGSRQDPEDDLLLSSTVSCMIPQSFSIE